MQLPRTFRVVDVCDGFLGEVVGACGRMRVGDAVSIYECWRNLWLPGDASLTWPDANRV